MIEALDSGHKIIGNGEAASIALAKKYEVIVANNNLKLITEEEGNYIWEQMINKRRKLGANTFSEYLKNKG